MSNSDARRSLNLIRNQITPLTNGHANGVLTNGHHTYENGGYIDNVHSKTALDDVHEATETDSSANETVILNVGGSKHEVRVGTLKRLQNTRLATLASKLTLDESYNPLKGEYYFDRNPYAFGNVLEFYRTGELHIDQNSCGTSLTRELRFWGLSEADIAICCWPRYDDSRATTQVYKDLDKLFDDGMDDLKKEKTYGCLKKAQYYLWHTMEHPTFSVGAKIFTAISITMTLASIFGFIAETHHVFQQIKYPNDTVLPAPSPTKAAATSCYCPSADTVPIHITNHSADAIRNSTHNETETEHEDHTDFHLDPHIALHYLDYVTLAYFTLEYIIRFIVAPKKRKFLKKPMNNVDLIAILAHFTSLIYHFAYIDNEFGDVHTEPSLSLVFLFQALRVMRVVRVFRIFNHVMGFKVLLFTIWISMKELALIVSFLLAGVLISASIIHYVEAKTFPSIPYAIWWALVTMTTVGYGDVVPKTPMGYLVGALSVISGVLVIAFTVPIVVNNFTQYYTNSISRKARVACMKTSCATTHNFKEQTIIIPEVNSLGKKSLYNVNPLQ